MKRPARPALSPEGEAALAPCPAHLRDEQDLSAATRRNYASDLRHFAAWCEHSWGEGQDQSQPLTPAAISTPTLTSYRSYLQAVLGLRPATINRHLVSLKRYFAWAADTGLIARHPGAGRQARPAHSPAATTPDRSRGAGAGRRRLAAWHPAGSHLADRRAVHRVAGRRAVSAQA